MSFQQITFANLCALLLAAVLACAPSRAFSEPNKHEAQRISALLHQIGLQSNMRFQRGSTIYSSVQAQEFLRRKYEDRIDSVKTLDDFVVKIGSVSSMTGEPYKVITPGGVTILSADFLHQLASKIPK